MVASEFHTCVCVCVYVSVCGFVKVIYLAGDSSLDNKYWFEDSAVCSCVCMYFLFVRVYVCINVCVYVCVGCSERL